MEFELVKTGLKPNKWSSVKPGEKAVGKAYIKDTTKGNLDVSRIISNLNKVKVGDEIMVIRSINNFVKTSPIESIEERTDTFMKFTTTTSFYELRISEDE